jgi:hypothetical protein
VPLVAAQLVMLPVSSVVGVELTLPVPVTVTCRIDAGTQVSDVVVSQTPLDVVVVTAAVMAGGKQSLLTLQPSPTGHCRQTPPPQSTSVSWPFCT